VQSLRYYQNGWRGLNRSQHAMTKDIAYDKNRLPTGRDNGPHPYETGAAWVSRNFTVTKNCACATQVKLAQLSGQAR